MQIKTLIEVLRAGAYNYDMRHNCGTQCRDAMESLLQDDVYTISTADKMPIDMPWFLSRQEVRGAAEYDYRKSYSTLVDMYKAFADGELPNICIRLDFMNHNFMWVDIEPVCEATLRDTLINNLDYIYLETSMSGKGYHAMMYVPELGTDVKAVNTSVIKPSNDYEILISSHCVTLTGNLLGSNPADTSSKDYFIDLFTNVGNMPRFSATKGPDEYHLIDEADIPNIAYLEPYFVNIINTAQHNIILADYDNDNSRFEFAMGLSICRGVQQLLNFGPRLGLSIVDANGNTLTPHEYTYDEIVACVHICMKGALEERKKHHEFRDGIPWLYYLSYKSYELFTDTQ